MKKIKSIDIKSQYFPNRLRKIPQPPKKIFFIGSLLPLKKCFAIVGTRRCSSYGKEAALRIAGDLAEAGMTIVSGLAEGIDTCAHVAAVEKRKRTIAVLGTGLDRKSIYPKSNLELAERILETRGCLISEYPPRTRGNKFTFPRRNRIISGLSLGVLVVEAKIKSGALITAGRAKKQGRPVFALPGSIRSQNSKGCHYLIKTGAHLIENAEDILRYLGMTSCAQKESPKLKGDSKKEDFILESLKKGPLHVDQIIKELDLPSGIVVSNLISLENKKKIRNLGDNTFGLLS
ncbi:MAG: DNA-protecting protein DprA [Candidatus Nealsonbacteria bacterium]|nr:DNA-protecting protein DprA [Candidatus Nealsonbacteria bacterium]